MTFRMKPRPMFLMAARPKRMPPGTTVKLSFDSLISGGRSAMSMARHSAIYSEILTELSRTEVMSAAMYSRG